MTRKILPTLCLCLASIGLGGCSAEIKVLVDLDPAHSAAWSALLADYTSPAGAQTVVVTDPKYADFQVSFFRPDLPLARLAGVEFKPEVEPLVSNGAWPIALTLTGLAYDQRRTEGAPSLKSWKDWSQLREIVITFPEKSPLVEQAWKHLQSEYRLELNRRSSEVWDPTQISPQLILTPLVDTLARSRAAQTLQLLYFVDGLVLGGIWVQRLRPEWTEATREWAEGLLSIPFQNRVTSAGWISPLKKAARPPGIRQWRSLKRGLKVPLVER
jgi:hypothetical protein